MMIGEDDDAEATWCTMNGMLNWSYIAKSVLMNAEAEGQAIALKGSAN